MAKATSSPKRNIFSRFAGYLGDVRAELKRVVWPTKNEVVKLSMVVMVTIAFFVAFTFLVDSASVSVIRLIGRIGG